MHRRPFAAARAGIASALLAWGAGPAFPASPPADSSAVADAAAVVLTKTLGDGQRSPFPGHFDRLQVRATDAQGRPLAHVEIVFTCASPACSMLPWRGGYAPMPVRTDSEGYATLYDRHEHPPSYREGVQIVRARAGSAAVTFTLEVTPPTN